MTWACLFLCTGFNFFLKGIKYVLPSMQCIYFVILNAVESVCLQSLHILLHDNFTPILPKQHKNIPLTVMLTVCYVWAALGSGVTLLSGSFSAQALCCFTTETLVHGHSLPPSSHSVYFFKRFLFSFRVTWTIQWESVSQPPGLG